MANDNVCRQRSRKRGMRIRDVDIDKENKLRRFKQQIGLLSLFHLLAKENSFALNDCDFLF